MSRLVVVGVPAPPQGVPVTSHYLSLDLALDITVMATATPCWIVTSVQKARAALALYVQESVCAWTGNALIPALTVGALLAPGSLRAYSSLEGPSMTAVFLPSPFLIAAPSKHL